MNETAFQEGLIEAKKKIESLPGYQQGPLLELLEETRTRQVAIQENSQKARTALDDLRLSLAYLAFDYEATMREVAQCLEGTVRESRRFTRHPCHYLNSIGAA